ncbi:MAG: glutathionylspermidine synthase family protein, partial [Betaproteobacteria bacterium]|nr:glutathionylspermidine synthase family protein [Betaproteobacteria bacterium]
MKRESHIPRPNWPQKMEAVGFGFHSIDGIYWDERACYALTAAEVDTLEAATAELHQMSLATVQHVIDHQLYEHFAIPQEFVPLIETSWRNRDVSLFGRFDFSWDGNGPPKMLEYNADTPTSLIEASIAQWDWFQDVIVPHQPDADQFNSLHEKLIARWQTIAAGLPSRTIHFACVGDSEEDVGNLDYLCDTAMQAGIEVRYIDIKAIGWATLQKQFVDQTNTPIQTLFKLYPWEWMVREAFGRNLFEAPTQIIEPAWKMLLANKA